MIFDASIIIVNYNTKELLLNTIRSIFSFSSSFSFEVIVVDNASIDASQEAVRQNFPNVLLIELNENIGFGRANNVGAKEAKGDFLFFLNSDTIFLNNALDFFINFNQKNKELKIGCIGAFLLDEDFKSGHSFGVFPAPNYILKDAFLRLTKLSLILKKKDKKEFLSFLNVDYVTGADLFVERKIFLEHEGFDKDFFMYFEESDFQYRLYKKGYKNLIIDGPKIIHLEGKSYSANQRRRLNYTKSLFLYIKKHHKESFLVFKLFYFFLKLPGIFNFKYTLKERVNFIKFLYNLN
ncbi:glycosyltransferase family 2 protein [Flavobacterium sp.]|jgi:GT2 family glycosyltransferase|uniref:glycosyltransferase family 2 protein n=1 Tax=Flavobacterium sp. TaxID=239 RepID=UPI0037BF8AAD